MYYNADTHEWPLTKREVQNRFPTITFAVTDWPPSPYYEIKKTEVPEYNPLTHRPVEIEPVADPEGGYKQEWSLVAYDPSEVALNIEREVLRARTEAHARINTEYTVRTNVLASGYPENEQKSWPIQVEEAKAYTADPGASVPWIENAATARGISKSALVTLILAQDQAYRELHGTLSGVRQALRNQIDAYPVEEASIGLLEAVEWPAE